jgi:solute carrier family 25 carnitine/acylcarnitine transporter 20/29
VTYNRSLALINNGSLEELPSNPSAWSIWTAGALGGLATFFVSAPTELVKCRAQVSQPPRSSAQVVRELWAAGGLRGLYMGGAITSMRDAVGYGF